MDIIKKLQQELHVRYEQVEAAVKLMDEGNTIPFIARYRKEVTGSLNDEILRNLSERLTYLRNLEDRKETVLKSIESQGKLTEDLRNSIVNAETLIAVEDLYRPYKQKRRTRAMIAREKGLGSLADIMRLQMTNRSMEEEAKAFLNEDVVTVEEALQGARDIIAESIADEAAYRSYIRKYTVNHGVIASSKKGKVEDSVYEMYYDFEEAVKKIPGHRILAINRGEKEKILSDRKSVV